MGAVYETEDSARLDYNGQTPVKEAIGHAFWDLVDMARYDNGHGGYTGTIAEAHSYEVVGHEPSKSMALAEASKTSDNKGKYPQAEKWEQSYIITYGEDKDRPTGIVVYGCYSS